MTHSITSSLGMVLTCGFLTSISTACAGDGEVRDAEADGLDGVAPQGEALTKSWRSRHRSVPHPGGALAGSGGASQQPGVGDATGGGGVAGASRHDAGSGSGDVRDCAVCAKANACCTDIQAGALCTFSVATCASLEPVARQAYVVNCKTLIDTVVRARTQSPSSCQ